MISIEGRTESGYVYVITDPAPLKLKSNLPVIKPQNPFTSP